MPLDIHLDVNPDLWALAKITALPPVLAGHAGGGSSRQQQADSVRFSLAAEILGLAEGGHSASAIAQALEITEEDVVTLLAAHDDTEPTAQYIAQAAPTSTSPIANAERLQAAQGILVEATRNASGNMVPTPVPMIASRAEAPALAGPPGMTNPTIERRNRRRRRKDRRKDHSSQADQLWPWPLAGHSASPVHQVSDPWRKLGNDEVLEAAAHEWTDAEGISIPGGRLALPETVEERPES